MKKLLESQEALLTFTCGEASLCSNCKVVTLSDVDLELFKLPALHSTHSIPYPYNEGSLKDIVVDPKGVHFDDSQCWIFVHVKAVVLY